MNKRFLPLLALMAVLLLLAACSSPAAEAESDEMHMEEDGHSHSPEEHMAGAHNVPEEAAAVPNPIAATDESVDAGRTIFATNCAVCHGEEGRGDGPGAAGLDPQPADLNAGHVQGLSDGGLFYIVSHGKPDSPMPAWEGVLTEDQRWNLINFLRTFQGDEHVDDDHHDGTEAETGDDHHDSGDDHHHDSDDNGH